MDRLASGATSCGAQRAAYLLRSQRLWPGWSAARFPRRRPLYSRRWAEAWKQPGRRINRRCAWASRLPMRRPGCSRPSRCSAALEEREVTGRGTYSTCNVRRVAVPPQPSYMARLIFTSATGASPQRAARDIRRSILRMPSAPAMWLTSRWLAFYPGFLAQVCGALGRVDLPDDPRFRSFGDRLGTAPS